MLLINYCSFNVAKVITLCYAAKYKPRKIHKTIRICVQTKHFPPYYILYIYNLYQVDYNNHKKFIRFSYIIRNFAAQIFNKKA